MPMEQMRKMEIPGASRPQKALKSYAQMSTITS